MRSFLILASLYTLLVEARPVVPDVRPLVIWHGLGDSAHSKGIEGFIEAIKEVKPDMFVHSVSVMDNEDDDKKAGFVSSLVPLCHGNAETSRCSLGISNYSYIMSRSSCKISRN